MNRFFFVSMFLLPITVNAMEPATEVMAEVLDVRHGDTVNVMAHPWPGFSPTTAIRISGIDTPEMRGKCDKEIAAAVKAKQYLESVISEKVTLVNVRYGKYAGRYVSEIMTDEGVNISDAMIEAGHARAYDGGKRKGWCE